MPHRLASLPKPPLSDDDLKALGLAVANWAIAEAYFENTLCFLAVNDAEQKEKFRSQRLISFSKKADFCKKLLKLICFEYPSFIEFGAKLITRGKELSNRRKIIAHWCASKKMATRETLFMDMGGLLFGKTQTESLTREDILSLAADIAEWSNDICRFNQALLAHGPTASRTIEL